MSEKNPCKRKAHRFAMMMMRRVFHAAQNGECGICRKPMAALWESPKLTFDHVWPKAWASLPHGDWIGTFLGNILLAHDKCNVAKADAQPTPDQVAFLGEVNRKLGLKPNETALWDKPAPAPTPRRVIPRLQLDPPSPE